MSDLSDVPLFAAAGIVLEDDPNLDTGLRIQPSGGPEHQRKHKTPTPAQLAAAVRLEGGRRHRAPQRPGQRTRVGQPRDITPTPVLAFPLHRNVNVLAEVIERLPHGYAHDLDKRRDQEVRILEKRLLRQGLRGQVAWRCARELVHVAYIERVRQAHKEAGIL